MSLGRAFRILLVLVGIGITLASHAARADVWPTNADWDDSQEQVFSDWIRTLPLDIFIRGTYAGIPTDCAEAVYTLRVIFAYEHGLPVDFYNSDGKNLSNENGDFDGVPEGLPRLRKFIDFVRAHTNTDTLVRDTYPIAINRQTLRAGAVFLHPQGGAGVPVTYRSGHVYYIQDVLENGMIRYFSSTVPQMARELQSRIDITFAPMTADGGYRAWKRLGSDERPGLSREQFSFAGWHANSYMDLALWTNWQHEIRSRLQLRPATPAEELQAKIGNVRGYVQERARLVQIAWHLYQTKYHGQACMGAADYDDYSTPTRDVKIQDELQDMRSATAVYLRSRGQSASDEAIARVFAQSQFQVLPGVTVDANQLWNTFMSTTVLAISEPEHSPQVRWGLEAAGPWPCPARAKQYVGGDRVRSDGSVSGEAPAASPD